MSYDYIVIGAGSAGCVVAHRLVRNYGASVLLLEAGGSHRRPLVDIPAGAFKMMFGNGDSSGPMAAAQLIAHHFTNESLFMFAAIPAAFSSLMIAGLAKIPPRS